MRWGNRRDQQGAGAFSLVAPLSPPPTLMRPPVFAGQSSGEAGFAELTDVCLLLTTQLADGPAAWPGEPAGPCGLAFFYAKVGQRDGHAGGIPTGGTLTRDGRATGRVPRPLEPFTCTRALRAASSISPRHHPPPLAASDLFSVFFMSLGVF